MIQTGNTLGSTCATQDWHRVRLAQHWLLIKLSSRHHIYVELESHVVTAGAIKQERHNIPSQLSTNIPAIDNYQLNKRPTLSLLVLTGASATAAGLSQPAWFPLPQIKLKGKGRFPVAFLTAVISTPRRIGLQGPAAATRLQRPADQLHRSITARLPAVNSEQRRAEWRVVNGGHRGK